MKKASKNLSYPLRLAIIYLASAHYRQVSNPAVDYGMRWILPASVYMKPHTFLALVARKLANRRRSPFLTGSYEYEISDAGLVFFHQQPENQEKFTEWQVTWGVRLTISKKIASAMEACND